MKGTFNFNVIYFRCLNLEVTPTDYNHGFCITCTPKQTSLHDQCVLQQKGSKISPISGWLRRAGLKAKTKGLILAERAKSMTKESSSKCYDR